MKNFIILCSSLIKNTLKEAITKLENNRNISGLGLGLGLDLSLNEVNENKLNDEEFLRKLKLKFLLNFGLIFLMAYINFYLIHEFLNDKELIKSNLIFRSAIIMLSNMGFYAVIKFNNLDKFPLGKGLKKSLIANFIILFGFFGLFYYKLKKDFNNNNMPFRILNDINRIEDLKNFEEILIEEENKFENDSIDIFEVIYNEIYELKDEKEKKKLKEKLKKIFEE